jgi:3-phenylpropionate/trans-cinnamate dioxygenase ferredoxin subunit
VPAEADELQDSPPPAGLDAARVAPVAELDVCPVAELPPGTVKIVDAGSFRVGVYNCGGEYFAIEDRCSHDDGPLAEGTWDDERCVVVCPRHGANFDLRSGRPLTLPAVEPVDTFPVRVVDGVVRVQVD